MSPLRAGSRVPLRVVVTAPSRATIVPTVVRKAGSVTLRDALVTTTSSSSGSDAAPPDCMARLARPDSVCASSLGLVALTALIPPRLWLATKRPSVTTNQAHSTGQRWRALQSATRTVQGRVEPRRRCDPGCRASLGMNRSIGVPFPVSSTGRLGPQPRGCRSLSCSTISQCGNEVPLLPAGTWWSRASTKRHALVNRSVDGWARPRRSGSLSRVRCVRPCCGNADPPPSGHGVRRGRQGRPAVGLRVPSLRGSQGPSGSRLRVASLWRVASYPRARVSGRAEAVRRPVSPCVARLAHARCPGPDARPSGRRGRTARTLGAPGR